MRGSGERGMQGTGRDPDDPREQAVLRLRRAQSRVGLHQPGHHAVHRLLRNPQVDVTL